MSKVTSHRPTPPAPKPLTMSKAVSGGMVTGSEATRIAKTYEKDGALESASSRAKLDAYFESHVDDFMPAAQSSLEHLLKVSMPKISEPTGTANSEMGGINGYQLAKGSLFVNGVSDDDFEQGDLGDCYFLSAVNSIAQHNPQAIQNLFHANANGTVTVTFQGSTEPGGPTQPIPITVDRRLPTEDGSSQYVTSRNSREIWPELLEKAYAQFCTQYPSNAPDQGQGGFDAIGQGGTPSAAYLALTGQPSSGIGVSPANSDDVWSQLCNLASSGTPMVATSHSTVGDNLVGDHCYHVLGVTDDASGNPCVILHNPWGTTSAGTDQHDGTFTLPLADFTTNFGYLTALGARAMS